MSGQLSVAQSLPRSLYRWFGAKNCQMVSVALSAVDGAEMLPTHCASGLGSPPGHWWPAPITEINSTVRPSAHPAVWVVTSPAVVELGCPHPSIPRYVALTASTEGPSTRAVPSAENALPGPPL
jgi:hypothetical protein